LSWFRRAERSELDAIRILADQLQEGFALYDSDDRLLFANQEFVRLHKGLEDMIKPGMRFEDMIRASVERGQIPGAVGREEAHVRERLAQHRNPAGSILRTLSDGTSYIIKESLLPDGRVAVTQTDVSEMTQAKEALRVEQERFKELAEIASDWFWETDAKHRMTTVVAPVEKVGMSLERMRGKTRWELANVNPEEDSNWAVHLADLNARRPFRDFRYSVELQDDHDVYHRVSGHSVMNDAGQALGYHSFRRNDGNRRHFSASGHPVYDARGEFVGYRGMAREITEEVIVQEQARAAHQRLLDAIESMPESFVLYDAEDRVVLCNSASYNKMPWCKTPVEPGMKYEHMMQEIAYSGLVVEARGREEEWIRESVALHRNPAGPREIQRTDGNWLLITERKTSDGGIVAIRMDVTDQKRAQIDREDAIKRAEEANRAKSNFLANMSHELRTPLNAIIGMSEMMSLKIFGPMNVPRYEGYVESIATAGRHLLELVNDILDISRIESGNYTFSPQTVQPLAIIEDCRRLILEQPARGHADIVIDIDNPPPDIRSDVRAVRQILLNLMGNAIKFTPPDEKIWLRSETTDTHVAISVVDSGPGIAERDLDRIVRPFERADQNAYLARDDGLGLGLAICNTLAEGLGGELIIDSEVGVGTTVTLRLPRAESIGAKSA
jgi:signal transduction histidine kinase